MLTASIVSPTRTVKLAPKIRQKRHVIELGIISDDEVGMRVDHKDINPLRWQRSRRLAPAKSNDVAAVPYIQRFKRRPGSSRRLRSDEVFKTGDRRIAALDAG